MPDRLFKDENLWTAIKRKVLNRFNIWYYDAKLPKYMKTGKIFPLSKDQENG